LSESIFIHPAEARRRFREFAEGDIGNGDLARGALLIALEDYPQLDVDHYLRALDELAERAVGRGRAGELPVFRLGHLHAEMFDVDRYGGNGDHYYDPRNAYLNEVIDRKVGLPILLSIIFLHVAERIGLTVHGVGLPGHFIVKVQFELNELYVDPFHGGTTLTIAEIGELVGHASGGQVKLSAEHLRSWDARQTLVRVLANMQNMWARAGDVRKASSARERRMLLDTSPRAN
jgi:regulator of sirC expression with transglutaminase-like and TPR domain